MRLALVGGLCDKELVLKSEVDCGPLLPRSIDFWYAGGKLSDGTGERNSAFPRDVPIDTNVTVMLERFNGEFYLLGSHRLFMGPDATGLLIANGDSVPSTDLKEVCR